MTKISNNGTYVVQLKWSNPTSLQSPNIPANKGFDMEVLFLNASAPTPNAKTVPQIGNKKCIWGNNSQCKWFYTARDITTIDVC